MPKYEVTIAERRLWFIKKTFEAVGRNMALELAESDNS